MVGIKSSRCSANVVLVYTVLLSLLCSLMLNLITQATPVKPRIINICIDFPYSFSYDHSPHDS